MRYGQCFSQLAQPHIKRGKNKRGNDEEKKEENKSADDIFQGKKRKKKLSYQRKVDHMETSRTFKYGL